VTDLFTIYQDTYLAICAKYEHPDEPILYGGKTYCETLPPKGWSRETYSAYFADVMALDGWYRDARRYAAKRRKTAQDRATYIAACDRHGVAGHDLRFAGEPDPVLF